MNEGSSIDAMLFEYPDAGSDRREGLLAEYRELLGDPERVVIVKGRDSRVPTAAFCVVWSDGRTWFEVASVGGGVWQELLNMSVLTEDRDRDPNKCAIDEYLQVVFG